MRGLPAGPPRAIAHRLKPPTLRCANFQERSTMYPVPSPGAWVALILSFPGGFHVPLRPLFHFLPDSLFRPVPSRNQSRAASPVRTSACPRTIHRCGLCRLDRVGRLRREFEHPCGTSRELQHGRQSRNRIAGSSRRRGRQHISSGAKLTILILTGNIANSLTVYKGSSCRVY